MQSIFLEFRNKNLKIDKILILEKNYFDIILVKFINCYKIYNLWIKFQNILYYQLSFKRLILKHRIFKIIIFIYQYIFNLIIFIKF